MQTFAKEFVELQPDLILASTTPVVAAVAQETDTIPIVFGGYPAARRDGRRPASLVTRRGGVHRRVAACGSKGSEPGHERGHNAQRPAGAGASTLGSRRLGSSSPTAIAFHALHFECRDLDAGVRSHCW